MPYNYINWLRLLSFLNYQLSIIIAANFQKFISISINTLNIYGKFQPPSQAGADQSASWAPKSMIKAGKNQASPAARANRNNTELKHGAHRFGRAARHEFREWGDKHGGNILCLIINIYFDNFHFYQFISFWLSIDK